jgi:RNA polymerase sigma-70 factor (ECF subfamily)
LQTPNHVKRFEQVVLSHLDAAYNLARWLTHHEQDAEDIVQESYLRAFKFFHSFHGSDARPWLLAIVRNTYYTWRQQKRIHDPVDYLDEESDIEDAHALNPEELALQSSHYELLRQALEQLPAEFREVVILRELEGLSYKEIATITAVPLGTVMSRLARARKRLQHFLTCQMKKEE